MINPFDLDKHRELVFAHEPEHQARRALAILSGLPNLQAFSSSKPNIIVIHYNLRDYTLAGLERALELEGFRLDHSFLHHVGRNIIYYCEDTTRHNMEIRDHVTKKNEKDVFVGLNTQHLHHEHAGKPLAQREFE
ncbi:MAG: hypothetical protein A2342_10255 [Gallionellales bacterium RIFOXYB12_FULL_54_9]|nr:MAG: hypothetical protein A2342_10255 [Gallionellales bacterium RIFOXYB12_FULL_54_9]